jgi:type IV pilus assembly protein PilM
MAKDILGIEIGENRIKLVQMSHGTVTRFVSIKVPEQSISGDAVVAWDALADDVKKALKENKFSAKRTAVVIPDSETYVRRLKMPSMTESQLNFNLPYEFRDVIPDEKDKYIFDYSVIRESEDGGEMEILGAAISKEKLENYEHLTARAGLRLVKAAPRVMALQCLIRELKGADNTEDTAVINYEWNTTRVDIFHEGIYEVTRNIDTGVKDIVKAAAEKLNCDPHIAESYCADNSNNVLESPECIAVYNTISVEIMRALNYYTYENQGSTLNMLYYFGDGAGISRMIDELKNTVSLTIMPLSDLAQVNAEALINGADAVGICLE